MKNEFIKYDGTEHDNNYYEYENYIKKNFTNGDEFDAWGYCLLLNDTDSLNLQKDKARKVLPIKVKVKVKNNRLICNPYNNKGKLLKKEIKIFSNDYKINLKLFVDKNECFEEYSKDLEKALNVIENYQKKLDDLKSKTNDLKNELIKVILDNSN